MFNEVNVKRWNTRGILCVWKGEYLAETLTKIFNTNNTNVNMLLMQCIRDTECSSNQCIYKVNPKMRPSDNVFFSKYCENIGR